MWQPAHTLSRAGCRGCSWVLALCAGLSSVLFSQEVSGVRETWVDLSFPYHRDLQVWKADCLWASFRGQGHRGLRNYAMPLHFFL